MIEFYQKPLPNRPRRRADRKMRCWRPSPWGMFFVGVYVGLLLPLWVKILTK